MTFMARSKVRSRPSIRVRVRLGARVRVRVKNTEKTSKNAV